MVWDFPDHDCRRSMYENVREQARVVSRAANCCRSTGLLLSRPIQFSSGSSGRGQRQQTANTLLFNLAWPWREHIHTNLFFSGSRSVIIGKPNSPLRSRRVLILDLMSVEPNQCKTNTLIRSSVTERAMMVIRDISLIR